MKLEHDLLSSADKLLLQELARRLRPFDAEFAAEWVDAWVVTPQPPYDPDAYRQLMSHLVNTIARSHLELMASAELETLYQLQYDTNYDAARRQLGADRVTIAKQRDLHSLSRALHLVVQRWITRLLADTPDQVPTTMLAHARFAAQMAQISSEAYSDARDAYTQRVDEQLRQALDLAQRLASLSQALVQSLDTEPVLDLALHTAIDLLHTDGAAIMLIDESGTSLEMHTLAGARFGRPHQKIPVEGSLAGWVYRNDVALRSDRLPSNVLAERMAIIRLESMRTLIIVPLRMRGKPVGTMAVACEQERSFSDSEMQVLQTLADYAAIAIENARTHAAVREAWEQAERANRAKSEFIAAVSHEIRSPLNAILGYVDMLRDPSVVSEVGAQSDLLERLEKIARSTHRLTDDLLENARIEAGKLRIRITRVELPTLLAEVDDMLRGLVEGKPIAIRTELHAGPAAVRADPDRLRQILINLASNAAKFTQRGTIRLETSRAADPMRLDLSVRDSGPGIHPDDMPHVFELFYRGRSSDGAGGAGIGLFLSRQLALLMDADIRATSEPGQGTCFTVNLPIA